MKFSLKSNQVLLLMIFIILAVVLLFGSSYAFVSKSLDGNNTYSLSIGNFELDFTNNNTITLNNTYPVSDYDGLNNPSEFIFTINNKSNYNASYNIIIEENSSLKMSNVIKYSYNLNNNGYTQISLLKDNNTIIQNMILEPKKSDFYRIKFWMDENADSRYMNKTFSAKITAGVSQNEYKYATNVIENLFINKMDNIYGFNNNGENLKNYTEYRYVGKDVNNYVWFNCDYGYTSGNDHCDKWRIIGSFNNTWENGTGVYKSLKIISNDIISNKPYNNYNVISNFNTSTLSEYANGEYYKTIKDNAKNLILKAKWNIGYTLYNNSLNKSYIEEKRGNYFANIGVINTTDYAYAGKYDNFKGTINNEYNNIKNNWMYLNKSWLTMNLSSNSNKDVINVIDSKSGNIISSNIDVVNGFRPSVYLKPDVSIIGGYGTISNPYELDIKYPMSYGTVIKNKYITYYYNDINNTVVKQIIKLNDINEITENIPTLEGNKFIGWSYNNDKNRILYPKNTIYLTDAINLYAIYEKLK